MEERLKSDSLFTDIMINSTDYVFGVIDFKRFYEWS